MRGDSTSTTSRGAWLGRCDIWYSSSRLHASAPLGRSTTL